MSANKNDRIFVTQSSMAESVAVAWAAASEGIFSRGDQPDYDGEMLIHLDGVVTMKWWDKDEQECYVLYIDPKRQNGSYVTVYATEDQPPSEDAPVVWKS